MSEPAKSAEAIEDVLASIRRLVSGPSPALPQDDGAQRLMLTPSLRVMDPDDPWAPVPLKVEGHPDQNPDTGFMPAAQDGADTIDPAWGLEDRLADWGEISDSAEEAISDAMADGHEAAAPAPSVVPKFSRSDPVTTGQGMAEFEPETGDADWPDAGADNALRDLVLARGQVMSFDAAEAGASFKDEAWAAVDVTPCEHPLVEATQDTAPQDQDADQNAALEADDADDDYDAADDADDDLDDDLDDDIEDLGPSTSPFAFPDPEVGVLDEETLREIVAEVVRQELQGVLGQRITRNVRKMVRREIRLARAAEGLE